VSKVDAAIPEAGEADAKRLAAIDADTLARYVLDARNKWWRRGMCVEALHGRIPENHVPALLDRIRDPLHNEDVRIALLDLLGNRAELLPYLQAMEEQERFGIYEHGVLARGRSGDLTAAPRLATLAASPFTRAATLGIAGLDALVARHGEQVVEQVVGIATPEGRIFANRLRSSLGDLTPALADPDVGVARRAADLIIETGRPDDAHLLDHVVTGPTLDARLWAIYVLHRRGREIRELWAALDSPRVEIAGVPDDVRTAIARRWPGELECDPRWLIEQACAPPPEEESALLVSAVSALTAANLVPTRVQTGADEKGMGTSTYYVLETTRGIVQVSTLGRFAVSEDEVPEPRRALEVAGFRWIDDALAAIVVDKLPIYYFGVRIPRGVHALLFSWQD